jgi:hypothetical protein
MLLALRHPFRLIVPSPTRVTGRPYIPHNIVNDYVKLFRCILDPRVYRGRVRFGTAHELVRAGRAAEKCFQTLATPYMIIHGTSDCLTSVDASVRLHHASPSLDKVLSSTLPLCDSVLASVA